MRRNIRRYVRREIFRGTHGLAARVIADDAASGPRTPMRRIGQRMGAPRRLPCNAEPSSDGRAVRASVRCYIGVCHSNSNFISTVDSAQPTPRQTGKLHSRGWLRAARDGVVRPVRAPGPAPSSRTCSPSGFSAMSHASNCCCVILVARSASSKTPVFPNAFTFLLSFIPLWVAFRRRLCFGYRREQRCCDRIAVTGAVFSLTACQ